MKHYALIGSPVGHSFSKRYFDLQHFAEADYKLCERKDIEGLLEWVRQEGMSGFNVTSPLKQAVVPLMDSLSAVAAAVGAVNCVVVETDGRLTGHNTDAEAFRLSAAELLQGVPLGEVRAVVCGSGGGALAARYALGQLGIDCRIASRSAARLEGALTYSEAEAWVTAAARPMMVNATPLGMKPYAEQQAWLSMAGIRPGSFCYDLIYNPSPTLFLRQAAAHGAQVADGLGMLRRQAELSWQLWGLR